MSKNKMTSIEKAEWDELYQYVKKEILFYDDSQAMPSNFVLRLRGLTKGKYIDNKNIENKADYSFKVILYTFQICKPSIMQALSTKTFQNEMNKFNYICKIVENSINDVYLRLDKVKKSEEAINSIDTNVLSHQSGKYQKKTEDVKNKRLNELW